MLKRNKNGKLRKGSGIWLAVDWDLTDAEIMREFNFSREAVRRKRIAICGEKPNRRPSKLDWTLVNWNLTDSDIASMMGASIVTVGINRRKVFGATQTRPSKNNWSGVDWTRSNSVIATELGVSASSVRRARRESLDRMLANPKAMDLRSAIDWDSVDWNEPTLTIAKKLNSHHSVVVCRGRKLFGPNWRKRIK